MKQQNLSFRELTKLATRMAFAYQNSPVTIGLVGPLGAGKTTFVKHFVKALGVKKAKSPTFVITHQYKTNHQNIYHLDFYRLNSQKQLSVLGLEEIMDGTNKVLIEWVDKFPKLVKLCDIIIKIQINSRGGRDVQIKNNKI